MPQLKKEEVSFVEDVTKIINRLEEASISETKCAIFCLVIAEEEEGVKVFTRSTSNHGGLATQSNGFVLTSHRLVNALLEPFRKEK